jgi:hypothetical protein
LLGYGATLAEPALGALGAQVQEVTVGAFPRKVLMHSVALGVGLGMALGVARLTFGFSAMWPLLIAYGLLLALTFVSTEEFVAIAWDSGAVTTGPFTVPLVVAIGLGLTRNIPGVLEGFGILALASAGPILTVLSVGIILRRRSGAAKEAEA